MASRQNPNLDHIYDINNKRFQVFYDKKFGKFILQQDGKKEPCSLSQQQMRRLCEKVDAIRNEAAILREAIETKRREKILPLETPYDYVNIHLGGFNYVSIKYYYGQVIDIREAAPCHDTCTLNLAFRNSRGVHFQQRHGDFNDFFKMLVYVQEKYHQKMEDDHECCESGCEICNPFPEYTLAPHGDPKSWE